MSTRVVLVGMIQISFVHCILAACTPIPCSEECPVADPGGERGVPWFTEMLAMHAKLEHEQHTRHSTTGQQSNYSSSLSVEFSYIGVFTVFLYYKFSKINSCCCS